MDVYVKDEVAWFWKTKEQNGGLSNMAGGYPILVNGVTFLTSEALYQALKLPNHAEVQQEIINHRSPMRAKMTAKAAAEHWRHDWDDVKVPIMRWCLQLKLLCNYEKFSEALKATGDKKIVEYSKRDRFWGAQPDSADKTLFGENYLGKMLMYIRDNMPHHRDPVHTPDIKSLRILGIDVPPILTYGVQS